MAVTLNASTSSGLVQTADTSGTVEIQSNGTTKLTVASTGAYGQVVSGTAVTAATGSPTSIDFTSIPSWVKKVTLLFRGVSLSSTGTILVQIGSGSVTSSGYVSTAMSSTNAGNSDYTSTAGFITAGGAAANILSGTMQISLLTTNVYVASLTGKLATTSTCVGGGDVSLSGALDRVRITSTATGSNTFDAGTINILYEG